MLLSMLSENRSFPPSKQARKAPCLFNEAGQLRMAVPANTGSTNSRVHFRRDCAQFMSLQKIHYQTFVAKVEKGKNALPT